MGRDVEQVTAGGARAVGAGGDVKAAATGDHSSATYIENQYVQQTPEPVAPSPEETEEALRRYATRIRESYGRLDLEVLIPTEEGEHPPVGLDEVFVAPTVRADPPPVELPRDIRQRLVDAGEWPSSLPPGLEREALERVRQTYAARPARDVLEVLAGPDEGRIVLLGDPGAGKSTLARHLALTLTDDVPPEDPLEPLAGRVPLVVELREYAAGEWRERTFEDFLRHLHDTKGMALPVAVTEQLLAEGRAVVVFDGLDELFDPAAREQVSHRIAEFAGRHGVRVVVTSRVIGYQRGVLERAGFGHYMIQDLSKEQIARFARQWYGTAYPQDEERAGRLSRRLTDAVSSSRPVGELAGNPLLLTILAIIGRRRELPRDRQGVYRHAVAVLVAHWDEHAKHLRAPTDVGALSYLGDEDRHELLRLVARQMQDGEGGIAGNHIHQDELLVTFKEYLREQYELPVAQAMSAARVMVRQFRERNFILSHYGGGVYGFVHRAFLEYLAAEDIDRRYTRYREWTQEELIEQIFVAHAEDPAWHEVLLLLVGQLGEREAAAAIDRLLEMHRRLVTDQYDDTLLLELAVRALAEVRRIGLLAAQSRAVVDGIIARLEQVDVPYGYFKEPEKILSALEMFPPHWSGRTRFLRWFHLRGQERFDPTAGRFAARLYQDTAVPLAMAAHVETGQSRVGMLESLAARWGAGREIREQLRTLAADGYYDVRMEALVLLSGLHTDEDDIDVLIADRSVRDHMLEVRALALSLRGDTEDDSLWAPIVDLATSATSDRERVQALSLLAQYRGEDPEVRALLCRRATEDSAGSVRAGALSALIDLPVDDSVVALMRSRLTEDSYFDVRGRALSYLTRHSRDWELARRLAVEDEYWSVRNIALSSLRDLRRDDPDTWRLARRRAVEDSHGGVRATACTVLWETAGAQDGTWEFLRDRVAEDPDRQVRQSAFYGLVSLRANEADTYELGRELAVGDPDEYVRTAAVIYLCHSGGDKADTWELAFDQLRNNPATEVREETLSALRHYQGDETVKWDAIRACAYGNSEYALRRSALALLVIGRGDDAATTQLLQDLAINDSNAVVRIAALQWWAVCRTDEGAAEFLRVRALADPMPAPRATALQLLAFGWPAHPETLPFLRERAGADEYEYEFERGDTARALAAAEALAPLSDQLP